MKPNESHKLRAQPGATIIVIIIIIVTIIFALKSSLKHCISHHCVTMTTTDERCGNFEHAGTNMKRHHS